MGKIYNVVEMPKTNAIAALITFLGFIAFIVGAEFIPEPYDEYGSFVFIALFIGFAVVSAIIEKRNKRTLQINDRQIVVTKIGDEMSAPEYIYRDQVEKMDIDGTSSRKKGVHLSIKMRDGEKRKFRIATKDSTDMFGEIYLNTDDPKLNEQKEAALNMMKGVVSTGDFSSLFKQIRSQSSSGAMSADAEKTLDAVEGMSKIMNLVRKGIIAFFLFVFFIAFITILVPLIIGMIQ